jgi:hypothetical protein
LNDHWLKRTANLVDETFVRVAAGLGGARRHPMCRYQSCAQPSQPAGKRSLKARDGHFVFEGVERRAVAPSVWRAPTAAAGAGLLDRFL